MAIISDIVKYGPKPEVPILGEKNRPPRWFGGNDFFKIKRGSTTGGSKHSGPSGRRAGRYYAPSRLPFSLYNAAA